MVEKPPSDLIYDEGIVAMAKGAADAPGSSGSQFFVVTGSDAAQLAARVRATRQGQRWPAVVDKLGAIVTDPRTDAPEAPVVIESVRVSER